MHKRSYKSAGIALTLVTALAGCETVAREELYSKADIPTDVDVVITENDQVDTNVTEYVGKKAFVIGEVDGFVEPRTLRLDYDGNVGTSTMLVLLPQNVSAPTISEGDVIQVTGTMRSFIARDLEPMVGYSLVSPVYVEWDRKPVMVASQIKPATRR